MDEAAARVAAAEQDVEEKTRWLREAEAALSAHKDAYEALQRVFTTTPRQPSKPTVTVTKKKRRCAREIGGVVCGNLEKSQIHTLTSHLSYHPFVPPAQPAARPSSPSNGVGTSTPSLGTPLAGAPDAAHASSGGGSE